MSSSLAPWLCSLIYMNIADQVTFWKHCSPHRVHGATTFTLLYPLLIKSPGFLRMCLMTPHKFLLQAPLLSLSMLIPSMNTRLEFFIQTESFPNSILLRSSYVQLLSVSFLLLSTHRVSPVNKPKVIVLCAPCHSIYCPCH